MPALLTVSEGPGHTVGLAPRGVNSGNGFLFVSHLGEIMPSGFLPIPVGNVREMSLAQAYRETPLFQQLRTPSLFKGRCGRCEFREICGGSRSRAFGLTGDPFETDPWCGCRAGSGGCAGPQAPHRSARVNPASLPACCLWPRGPGRRVRRRPQRGFLIRS